MKTPKRQKAKLSDYATNIHYHDARSRWKRKNRVKQLKRSLEKYKHGTHLSGSVSAAYRRLQSLVRPGRHATLVEWANYLHELRRIQEHLSFAISNTALCLAYDAERKVKDRKEQE